jgi:membrane-associated phospholipid phosphatase
VSGFSVVRSLKNKIYWLRAHDEAIARWVSNVLSPPVVATFLAVGFVNFITPEPGMLWHWLLLALPLAALPPLAYVVWLVRRGELADIHMPHRQARLKPLGVMMVWLLICIVLLHSWGAPRALDLFLMAALFQIGVLSLVTFFWQISFHSATISAAAATAVAIGGTTMWPITITLLVPLVGWSRVRLRRHTFRQVTAGCLVGTIIALLMLIGLSPHTLTVDGS